MPAAVTHSPYRYSGAVGASARRAILDRIRTTPVALEACLGIDDWEPISSHVSAEVYICRNPEMARCNTVASGNTFRAVSVRKLSDSGSRGVVPARFWVGPLARVLIGGGQRTEPRQLGRDRLALKLIARHAPCVIRASLACRSRASHARPTLSCRFSSSETRDGECESPRVHRLSARPGGSSHFLSSITR